MMESVGDAVVGKVAGTTSIMMHEQREGGRASSISLLWKYSCVIVRI